MCSRAVLSFELSLVTYHHAFKVSVFVSQNLMAEKNFTIMLRKVLYN